MADTTTIEGTIKSFILDEFLPGEDPAQLTPSTPLVSSGILDSLATLKLVAFLEQEFSISIGAHEADSENLETLERIAALVRSKR
jgi:acyl carrier protein